MTSFIKNLAKKIRSWKQAEVHKPPLSSERAYSLYAVGKQISTAELYKKFYDQAVKDIKTSAYYNRGTDVLIHYPVWLSKEHKASFLQELQELKYSILFSNENMCLISWKVK